ncbi:MAG: division/cell wall cluster transcriptional repressor MraZ [Patescibacteria group bacterium]
MLLGKFYHTLEANGRISLPKKLRDAHLEWVVTRGLDGGLFLIGSEQFIKELDSIAQSTLTHQAHRDFIRLMTNEAVEVKPDSIGRVQLPEYLIEFAQLKKEVVIVGSLTRIEIWDRDRYHLYIGQQENNANALADTIAKTED